MEINLVELANKVSEMPLNIEQSIERTNGNYFKL